MSDQNLQNKRILITCADVFMGPVLCDVFAHHGATVIASTETLLTPDAPGSIVVSAGRIDVLVANLAVPVPSTPVTDVSAGEWRSTFAALVDPLPQLFKAVLPQMIERRAGKTLLMGSATALRGMERTSTYSAVRGAQLAYVQAVGVEVASYNVQVNAIAQNFVDIPMYFSAHMQADACFQESLMHELPLGRLVGPKEGAEFAAYLCSELANCFIGQIFPVCGGWVAR
jgi:NAD(P)-dependent dehydrogenase (short-subunit alcohol dehydrogenase family)